jgi:methylmalonyl-CoA mutase N-terminal domain/subunit
MSEARSGEQARQRWESGPLAESLRKCPERENVFLSASGEPIDRIYVPSSINADYLSKLGFPGEPPFTRGVQPTMYRGRLWTVRQYAGFGDAEESNRRYKYLLEQGNTGLSVAFDLPTQIGYDSDDPLAVGEVGRVGVAIDTVRDMEVLFEGIPLDRVSTSMTINATAAILLAMYCVVAERRGVPPEKVSGTLQNDILKEYIARGTYRFPPAPSLRLVGDILAYCSQRLPKWNTISISGYHIREAGATAAQEVGFTLANAIRYIETGLAAGLRVDEFAPRLAFFFAAHTDLFEEVAKFRAARRLYARIMRERFKAANPQSMMMRFHTQTGGVTLTAQKPDNNVVRVTLQALAAVLGGTQSLHTNSKDEALALPTQEAVAVAVDTQHVLAHESGVASTADPLGGSYFVEALTDRIEAEAEELIAQIDGMGGVVTAIERGWVQARIEQAAYRYNQSIERGERRIVGVNAFTADTEPRMELFRLSEEALGRQMSRLRSVRASRNPTKVAEALAGLESAARGSENLMPLIVAAVREHATVGEISAALARAFGEYRPAF